MEINKQAQIHSVFFPYSLILWSKFPTYNLFSLFSSTNPPVVSWSVHIKYLEYATKVTQDRRENKICHSTMSLDLNRQEARHMSWLLVNLKNIHINWRARDCSSYHLFCRNKECEKVFIYLAWKTRKLKKLKDCIFFFAFTCK